jgi:hypothetical protein
MKHIENENKLELNYLENTIAFKEIKCIFTLTVFLNSEGIIVQILHF